MTSTECLVSRGVVDRFSQLNIKNRLAHAYLFVGLQYSGKLETALEIAKLINCQENENADREMACGMCSECMKIDAGGHPDIHIIDNGYHETVKIEQVREITSQVKFRPFSAQKKIFIIRCVDNLTIEGANALLKTLEEPTASSLLILTSSYPENIPDTVRSRCHTVFFSVSSQSSVAARLEEKHHLSKDASHFLAYFAQGCIGRAQKLNEDGLFDEKNRILDEFVFSYDSESYLKKILSDKIQTKKMLDIVLSWVHDAILLKTDAGEESLIHRDRTDDLKNFADKYSFEELRGIQKEIISANKLLADNLNVKMALSLIKERLWSKQ